MGAIRGSAYVAAIVVAHPAYAQRTDNNAVVGAEDAFGRSVGDQSIGIYNVGDVRGFSPIEAGNVRLEELYFDLQANLSQRTVAGSRIRVGISTQGYPFPAPTGIVDYKLRRPGKALMTSVALNIGPWKGVAVEADVDIPIDGDRLGIAAGIDVTHDGSPYGTTDKSTTVGVSLRYAPTPGTEIIPFWSRTRDIDYDAQPIIYPETPALPKRIPRNLDRGQGWADYSGVQTTYGAVLRTRALGLDVAAGVFRSQFRVDQEAADLLFRTAQDGSVARRVIVLEAGRRVGSTSGEVRVSRSFTTGRVKHDVIASVRARAQDRAFGASTRIVFPTPSRSDAPDPRPEPPYSFGPQTSDRVRQQTFGLAYRGKWLDVGELTLGLQKLLYTKRVGTVVSRDQPLRPSVAGAVYVTPRLALYAGYTLGLEESETAPADTENFNEAPPAIRTRQIEGGLRWTISPKVNLIAGAYDLSKSYFGVDNFTVPLVRRFRQLGIERRRGIELSLAGQVAPGLSLVAGQQFLDSTIEGDEVARGRIGRRPPGAIANKTLISVNYRLPKVKGLSVDSTLEASGNRTANIANTYVIPPRAVLSVGARYRFEANGKPFLIRALVGNVFNNFGWNVSRSGGFTANSSRRIALSISADL